MVDKTFPLECAQMYPEDHVVVISSSCMVQDRIGLSSSHLDGSPVEIWMSRTFALLVLSGFAYSYETIRAFAMDHMEEMLKEKEAINRTLKEATRAKIHFLSNMSHGNTLCCFPFVIMSALADMT